MESRLSGWRCRVRESPISASSTSRFTVRQFNPNSRPEHGGSSRGIAGLANSCQLPQTALGGLPRFGLDTQSLPGGPCLSHLVQGSGPAAECCTFRDQLIALFVIPDMRLGAALVAVHDRRFKAAWGHLLGNVPHPRDPDLHRPHAHPDRAGAGGHYGSPGTPAPADSGRGRGTLPPPPPRRPAEDAAPHFGPQPPRGSLFGVHVSWYRKRGTVSSISTSGPRQGLSSESKPAASPRDTARPSGPL